MNKIKNIISLVGVASLLSACNIGEKYNEFIEEKAEITTVTEQTTVTPNVDIRLVPEFIQVEEALKQQTNVTLGDELYRLKSPIKHSQEAFDVQVNKMVVLKASAEDETLGVGKDGAIVIINASITNKMTESIYFPIDEMRLSYIDATISHVASQGLYPVETGNLTTILENSHNEITAASTVEGYLVYGVSAEDLVGMKTLEAFYLSIVPPTRSADDIVGLSSNVLGTALPLYLPISEEAEEAITYNQQFIQDRLTSEWWGTKTLISKMYNPMTENSEDVKFTLKKIEMVDFVPHTNQEEAFQYFPNGQVIVTIEFEVENHSQDTLLPIDSLVSLVIGSDVIQSDYVLINQLYGQKLLPNERTNVIKTFALDKQTYQQNWQSQDIEIIINMGIAENESFDVSTLLEETTEQFQVEEVEEFIEMESLEETESVDESQKAYSASFIWKPNLEKFVNDALELVDDLNSIEETTVDRSETTTEIIDESTNH